LIKPAAELPDLAQKPIACREALSTGVDVLLRRLLPRCNVLSHPQLRILQRELFVGRK
jgi:hypothetical protein